MGEVVTLRELRADEPTRRLEGTVVDADDTTVSLDDRELGEVIVTLDAIERARTVFEWGASRSRHHQEKDHTSARSIDEQRKARHG